MPGTARHRSLHRRCGRRQHGRRARRSAPSPAPCRRSPRAGALRRIPELQVVRRATRDDVVTRLKQKHREQEAQRICLMKIRERGLAMKLARVEQLFDGSRLIFYYTAEGRVDFRELVRDLAAHFRIRIEMRQIGVRDEAKMLGGYGSCGRPLCCTTFLHTFEPVSIKMAKQQNLSLNPVEALRDVRPAEVLPALRAAERQRREARRLRGRRGLRFLRQSDGPGVSAGGCGSCASAAAGHADDRSAADRRHRRRSGGHRSRDRAARPRRIPPLQEACDIVLYGPHTEARSRPSRVGGSRPRLAGLRTTRSSRRSPTREAGRIDAVATAPINKEAFAAAGLPWRGHTDLLAHLTGAPRVAMMFYAESLRVVLATVHIPLSEVPARADAEPRRGDHRVWPRANCRDSVCRRRGWRWPGSIRTPANTA